MGGSSVKSRKLYVDCLTGKSKICLIHGSGHSSDECKVLRDFGVKYDKRKPTKEHWNHPVQREIINRQQ